MMKMGVRAGCPSDSAPDADAGVEVAREVWGHRLELVGVDRDAAIPERQDINE